jgi:hypothetical protein
MAGSFFFAIFTNVLLKAPASFSPDQYQCLLFDSVIVFPPLCSLLRFFITCTFFIRKFFIMNMYVSNISFHTTETDLRRLFEQFGMVDSARIITDRETGRSRGFGFVEMPSEEQAGDAIKGLNNKEVEGRQMSVSVAREKKSNNSGNRW